MPMERKATMSKCGGYRYTLWRRWSNVENPRVVLWIMINPSTADARKDDPTVKRCIHFSKLWGYDALRIVNIYPLITPDIKECKRFAEWEHNGPDWWARDQIYIRNFPIVHEHILTAALVMAAWGSKPWADSDIEALLEVEMMDRPIDHQLDLYCLGTTKHGDPKHPLARGKHRVPNDQQPILWRADA